MASPLFSPNTVNRRTFPTRARARDTLDIGSTEVENLPHARTGASARAESPQRVGSPPPRAPTRGPVRGTRRAAATPGSDLHLPRPPALAALSGERLDTHQPPAAQTASALPAPTRRLQAADAA